MSGELNPGLEVVCEAMETQHAELLEGLRALDEADERLLAGECSQERRVVLPRRIIPEGCHHRRKRVMLFGDSITELSADTWGATLAKRLGRRVDILNRGYSGYNTAAAIEGLKILFQDPLEASLWSGADVVTIWFGANDACREGMPNHQHVPVSKYKSNLQEMVTLLWTQANSP